MVLLETPSRIWRRIEAIEGNSIPSLPSLPLFDRSASGEFEPISEVDESQLSDQSQEPIHSTPAATSSHGATKSTIRAPNSTGSTARFASSIASRSAMGKSGSGSASGYGSGASLARKSHSRYDHESFDVSEIGGKVLSGEEVEGLTERSVPEVYLPPVDDDELQDASLTEALESISRASSPFLPPDEGVVDSDASQKKYDYSVSLRSEPRPSPAFDRFRNVNFRKPLARSRTPSLSRTTPSPASSPTESTPHSSISASSPPSPISVPLVSPTTVTPAVVIQQPDESEVVELVSHHSGLSLRDASLPQDTDTEKPEHPSEDAESSDPTFSDEGPTPSNNRSPALSTAFSSPAPSTTFTPTPAYRPRSTASQPTSSYTPSTQIQQSPIYQDQAEDPLVTPLARRRSFLLDVINSNARPRMKFPTPHPRRNSDVIPRDPGTVNNQLQSAFAALTPRPRPSHPLAQTYLPSDGEESRSGDEQAEAGMTQLWSPNIAAGSPYEGDRASFISTASSHDLTTHPRANTSFDPVMMGVGGHGVGKFNAGKLNSYLHGLNRRLQEENEGLLERLRKIEEKTTGDFVEVGSMNETGRRRLSTDVGRRVSAGGSGLDDVREEEEEKAELEEMVEILRGEVKRCVEEKDEAMDELGREKGDRARDRERWKERMAEVERGVEGIVKELESKAEEAEQKAQRVEEERRELERRALILEAEKNDAMERAAKVEVVLESGKELGGELREANERVGKVMGDLRNANTQIRELEKEVMRSDGRVDELEEALREVGGNEHDLQVRVNELQRRIDLMQDDGRKVDEELRLTKDYAAALEADAGAAVERIEGLEDQLATEKEMMEQISAAGDQAKERVDALEVEAERASELAKQMEEALEAAETKMRTDEDEVAILKGRLATLERDREHSKMPVDPSLGLNPQEADVQAMEDELDDANKEIARLNTLLRQSPARKAIERAKDTKIEILEKEKELLTERIRTLRRSNASETPSKLINASGISPIHRQVLSMTMRPPRTPGPPLQDMSWLNTTAADPTVSPLIAEISRLQRELDRANESIDDKLDKLEDAGLGVVGLTNKLEDARARIVALEDEIARLSRREDRRIRRLERVRCQKCHMRLNLGTIDLGEESSQNISNQDALPNEPPTPPTKTSEALRSNLQSVNTHLETMKSQWEEEKQRLLGEKAVLQDVASRLNIQVRTAKHEVKRDTENAGAKMRNGVQQELDRAKRAIVDLETELKSERARLRALTTEQDRVQREKDTILLQLQRTESDMDDVKTQLHKFKHENHNLEEELRVNVNVDQRARLLEVRVVENAETIEQLRQERSLLIADHKDLQSRFSEVSEVANRLREKHNTSQTSHDNRRHQLDLHLAEIDELRRALSDQALDLQRTEEENDRLAAERSNVVRTVSSLEADLKRVKNDAEAFGRDLKLLRAAKEKLERQRRDDEVKADRVRKQSQTQIRLLNERLEAQQEQARHAREELTNHVCTIDAHQLSAIKLQHNKECKGLIVQIRYLKDKFTREASLRCDLGYQKQYLLVLLTRLEKSERTILASIAGIGFPTASTRPGQRRRKLKSVALCVVFILRARHASELWREQSSSKAAVAAALQEVRRRRALASRTMT